MPVVLSPNLRDDERLLNPLSVTVMVVALGALLLLLFPSDQMEEHLAQFEVADEISAKYLQVWLRVEPYDSSARLLLVRHLRALGHTHEASAELQPLLKQKGALGAQARHLSVLLRLVEWQALAVDEPERKALTGELIASIRGLSKEELSPEERVELAVACLWMERPDLAANVYAQLALQQPARSFDRWLEAGRWYLASGHPDKAASAFDSASRSTRSAVEAPRAAVLALDASRASNDALERARGYAAAFANQPTVLDRAVSIALAANHPRLASIWMEARARLDPEDQSVLRRKLEVELTAGHLQDAFSTSLELVRLEPKDNGYRLRLAEISEWVGQPQQALTQWTWLATHSHSTHAQDKALSLAQALWDWEVIVSLMESRSRRTGLSIPELLLANRALEELAEPDRAEHLTQTYLDRRPGDKEAWEYLVSLRRRKRDFEGALQTAEAIDARFGKQTKSLVVQAQILRQLRRPDQALARLRDYSKTTDPNDAEFWALLGDLAWTGGDYATAEQAYLWGWKAGVLDELSTEHLIDVSMRTGPPSRWLPIAEKAWEKFQKPSFLLRAMDELARSEEWERLAFFIGQIHRNESAFSGHELYWLAKARLAAHQQRYPEAFQAFRHALSIQPGSVIARSERLALALEHGSRSELASAADPYGVEPTNNPGEQALYADSLYRLDRRSEALWWFHRAAMANDALPAARLAYATQLEQAGYLDTAKQVRAGSQRRLHSTVSVPRLDLASAQARQSQRLYAELVYRREGVGPAMRWLQPLLAVSDPEARELAANWQLERGNIPTAQLLGRAKLHPWTRLALAMATHQSAEIRRITTEEGDSLTSLDKIA
ncbi:MAG TPA: tetratricopeptide repeat protein, partial [Myxococcaceae bacterium]|nr:tetratricopeptide repeat protein [Myxococcaceae bacterium]